LDCVTAGLGARGRCFTWAILGALLLWLSATASVLAQVPEDLIESLVANTGLDGNIGERFTAQKELVRQGKANPGLVVPLIVEELEQPHGYDNDILQQRIALIETLRDIGVPAEAAVPSLTALLEDQDRRLEWVHMSIGMALLAIGTPQAEEARHAATLRDLAAWRDRTNPADRASAVRWHDFSIRQELRKHRISESYIEASVLPLWVLGGEAESAQPTLLRAYGDPRAGLELKDLLRQVLADQGVADPVAASAALPPPPDALEEILADLEQGDQLILSFAIDELVRTAPEAQAVAVLTELLEQGRSPGAAANALRDIGPPAALPALTSLLPHTTHPRYGANIIQAVEALGAGDSAAAVALMAVLEDPHSPQRGLAASALGRLQVAEAVPGLIAALDARQKYTRILAARALGRIGAPAAAPAVPPLTTLLGEEDRDIQEAAALALADLGTAAAEAAPSLAVLLQSSDDKVKRAARRALASTGAAAAAEALTADDERFLEADRRELQRHDTRNDFEAMGRFLYDLPEARAVPLARDLLSHEATLVAYMACGILIRAGKGDETLPTLAEIIASGRAATDLNGRMGYDWIHGGGAEGEAMFGKLADYLEAHRDNYDGEARTRVAEFLKAMGR
jgi:HEAT repeat protein